MITKDQATQLLTLGGKMRDAQKTYFRTRSQTDLRCSKDYERRFDDLLKECADVVKQGSLL